MEAILEQPKQLNCKLRSYFRSEDLYGSDEVKGSRPVAQSDADSCAVLRFIKFLYHHLQKNLEKRSRWNGLYLFKI
jgi:hypothetical protein